MEQNDISTQWDYRNWILLLIIGSAVLIFILWTILPHADPKWFFDEPGARNKLEIILEAQEMYWNKHKMYGGLKELAAAHLIDSLLAEGKSSGYFYHHELSKEEWWCNAVPDEPGVTGRYSYFIDQTGIMRYAPYKNNNDPPADASSPPLGE